MNRFKVTDKKKQNSEAHVCMMNNSSGVSVHQQSFNKMHLAELVSWCTVNGLVAILAIFGNSLVIAAFAYFNKLRTRTTYFVVGLAAADILVGLLSIPFWIATMVSIWLESVSWMSNSLLYRAFIALDVFSGIASILHLLLISLERLYAIGWPVKHRVSSRRSYLLSAFMAWCIAFVATAMFVPEKSLTHFPRFLVLQLCFFIPLTLICITYIMMGIIVKFHTHDANSWNHLKERKLILTIFFLIILFIAAWTPFMAVNIITFLCVKCSIPNNVVYLSKLLHYSNSAVNPLVYSYRLPEFKRAFYILLKGGKQWRRSSLRTVSLFKMKNRSLWQGRYSLAKKVDGKAKDFKIEIVEV